MCRIKKRKNKSSQFPPETGNIASSMNAQSNPKESTNAQANEQKIASSCDDQTKKTPGNHTIAISDAIEVKQQEQQTGEAHAVKRMEKLPEASPPEVKVPSGERKQKPSKRTAAFSEETAKKDELRTCSTQTPHTEGSMLLSKKQTVLDDATVTREMKPTDSRVTYELSTDDTLAGVPNVMPYFEDERIRCIHYHKSCGGSICCFEV
uniref:Uncharacterized protein n=1 Tax=Parascaris univalens TaxID=6257 RepID=A0A914ZYC1_PARUN